MNHTNSYHFARTDLAIERLDMVKEEEISGIKQESYTKNNVKVTTIIVDNEHGSEHINKPIGTYITIEPTKFSNLPTNFEDEVEVVSKQIKRLLPENVKSAIVVGLGNSQITPDALGPRVVRYTLATRHLSKEFLAKIKMEELISVSAISPGVLGQTGIESAQIISCLCQELSPEVVIIIDALASKSLERLGTTLQASNTGISPGSGVMNARKELSEQTLKTKVCSIGVPTVVDLNAIIGEHCAGNCEQIAPMMVTPREIDNLIEHAAKLIAYSITKALQPMLSVSEIASLVS